MPSGLVFNLSQISPKFSLKAYATQLYDIQYSLCPSKIGNL